MTENEIRLPRFDLADQVALVTGAGRGIGRATAIALAGAGADVAVGLLDPERSTDVCDQIERLGRRALPVRMDVRKLDEIESAVASVVDLFGRLDILVNNAGLGPTNLAEDVNEADFDLTFDINVKGTFFASQAAGRVMIRQGSGRIIHVSSQAGFIALPTESVYCISKAAVSHLARCLAVEWGRYGITVNAVAPTFIHTDGTARALSDPGFRAEVIERIAGLHRVGEPVDVAGAIVFLASPAASMITGTTLLVDGGWTAR